MTAAATAPWYAAQVKPRREALALTHLERQGFVTHCPKVERWRLRRGQNVRVTEPLFPGYVFVRGEQDRRWRSINSTIGVARLVTFGDCPAPVPAGFVERLQHLAGGTGNVSFEEKLAPGDNVRVIGGPFDDICGTLASSSAQDRVIVLLQMLSGETRVTLPRARLVAA
ncbi:transcription termination/antitermination protein NusG [Qipengyuania sp. CAU 1752]